MVVLPIHHAAFIAHQFASLDYISGGRAILGLGIGREHHFEQFEIPIKERVCRMREGVDLMKKIWTQPTVDHERGYCHLHGHGMTLKPVQKPHPPIWLGGDHPQRGSPRCSARRRLDQRGRGELAGVRENVQIVGEELEKLGRDPAGFPISKQVRDARGGGSVGTFGIFKNRE